MISLISREKKTRLPCLFGRCTTLDIVLIPRAACSPDGIGWQGVYFDDNQRGGWCLWWTANAHGRLICEKHTCIDGKATPHGKTGPRQYLLTCKDGIAPYKGTCNGTPCKDKKYCPKGKYCDTINPQVCMKRIALHQQRMSRSAGVLIVKRSSCQKNECSVFKSGLCIDLRRNVWPSTYNTHWKLHAIADTKGGMKAARKKFARAAVKLLKKHNNKLPPEHQCSDHRHRFLVQRKDLSMCSTQKKRCKTSRTVGKRCMVTCGIWGVTHMRRDAKHMDATLAKLAILNF